MKHLRLSFVAALSLVAQLLSANTSASADGAWTRIEQSSIVARSSGAQNQWVKPEQYSAFTINSSAVESQVLAAPSDTQTSPRDSSAVLTVPRPDGTFERFHISEVSTMEPGLAAKFPSIRTFTGVGIDDPSASLRGDITPQGFRGSVRNDSGWYYVDPLFQSDNQLHVSYFLKNSGESTPLNCLTEDFPVSEPTSGNHKSRDAFGTDFRTFRMAMAATGEYSATVDGTVAGTQAAIVSVVNRLNQIFEADVAVRFILVANNDQLIYIDGLTDPYTDNDMDAIRTENIANIDAVIGNANFDIGHVLNSTGSGKAGGSNVCNAGQKANGTSSIRGGSPLDNQSVYHTAHEVGHQFGAGHSWAGIDGNCNAGNFSASNAYEPGSGTTIMGYPGTCSSDNIRIGKEAYFHRRSLDTMMAFIDGGTPCAVQTPSGNTPPQINGGTDITVPVNTPFKLKATGSDVDGDTVFYTWEQFDLATAQRALGTADDGTVNPLFRSVFPGTNPARYFPANPASPTTAEILPAVGNRDLNFRVTGRDFRTGGGGTNDDAMVVHVIDAPATAFRVTVGNVPEVWSGTTKVITWDVAQTDTLPYNIFNVNVMMSVDGGNTYPYMLSSNTLNDGSELVALPNVTSTQVRIRVEPTGSGIYDISDTNVTMGGKIDVNPIVADFGVSCPGDVIDRTIDVFNTGNADLQITSVVRAGSSAFSLVPSDASPQPAPPVTIPIGGSIKYTLRMTAPNVPGPYSSTVTINSSDPERPAVVVNAAATVGSPNITVAPCPLEFGLLCAESLESAKKAVKVCNTGDCPLTISSISITGSDFQIQDLPALPFVLQSGSCFEYTLKFTPTSIGPKSETMTVQSNDPDSPEVTCEATGETIASTIGVPVKIPFEPAVIASIGHCPNDESLSILNTGSCNLKITTVTLSGVNADSFSFVGLPNSADPIIVASGQQLADGALKVRFKPATLITERFHQAQVNVTYILDPFTLEEATATVPLMGEAVETGFRILVRAGGQPVPVVAKISASVKGVKSNGKKEKVNLTTKDATLRTVVAPDPFTNDLSFQYHAEYGGITNASSIPTGEVITKVQIKLGKKKVTKTLKFQNVSTCTFNKDIIVDF